MNVDPEVNGVGFEIKRFWKRDMVLEQVPTRRDGGIRGAWLAAQGRTRAQPSQVRRIYSEWEPGPEDQAFLAETFPKAEVSYSFSRPGPEGWDDALEDARLAMQEAGDKELASQLGAEMDSMPRTARNLLP